MLIRPVAPGDKALLTGLFSELSAETRYRRFFAAVREMDDARFAFLTELDHHDREALVAVESVSRAGAGVARYVRVGDDVAEPAVVVADRWQRLGLGSVLLERLTARALEVGIARFRGLVLPRIRMRSGSSCASGTRFRERTVESLRSRSCSRSLTAWRSGSKSSFGLSAPAEYWATYAG
jgi:GNAT superfamily N-acetyltransferase